MYFCSLMGMLSARRPKRTLLFVLLFVVVAGVIGGPIAGSLQTEGGFIATASGWAKAQARIEAETGRQESPGVVALFGDKADAAAVRTKLQRQPGIASVPEQPVLSRDGEQAYFFATLTADADEDDVIAGLEQRFPESSG